MVVSAVYPMAFDEDFHLGIIKIYANHWLPFLSSQPDGADAFGAVARDPSYLYHYLMSFPYRLVEAITPSQTVQVIVLRLLNVAMVAYSLVLFRRIVQRALKSSTLTNVSMALFVLVPIVPQLAAHINYDNLIMILMAWMCLLVYRIIDDFKARRLNLAVLVLFGNLCMLTSLVKYAFLPIAVGAGLFVIGYGWHQLKGASLGSLVMSGWRTMSRSVLAGLVLLTLVSGGLFVQRFGVNAAVYHDPIADCGAVLDYEHCKSYGPWIRNHDYALSKGEVNENPLAYTHTWLTSLWYRLFFAVNGPGSNFTNYPPLPLPYITAALVFIAGSVLVVRYASRIFRDPFAVFSATVIIVYCAALWYEEYSQFVETGQPVAINGRYLIPIMFLVAILLGRGYQLALARHRQTRIILATVVLLSFLHGGGLATFILRSDASWDWPNQTVVEANNAARKVLAPITIEGSKYY